MNFGEQIWYVLSKEMSFETFIPCGPTLAKTETISQKSKLSNFTIISTTFVQNLPRNMHDFWD